MIAYEQELRRCKVVLLLRAVIEAGGNMSRAAANTGVHRNTIGRVLSSAGYNAKALRRLASAHIAEGMRKPVQSVGSVAVDERASA